MRFTNAAEPAGNCLQVKAALCAALYPNVAVKDEYAGRAARPTWNDGVADVYIHPSSINHPLEAQQFLRPYLVYLEKARAHFLTCYQTKCYLVRSRNCQRQVSNFSDDSRLWIKLWARCSVFQ